MKPPATDTEARLLKGLRKRCPGAPGELDLTGTMAALRQGQGLSKGQKVFVVLDQFEQWLHAGKRGEDAELAQALRQCDGERVQAVVLVRDDFWLAVSRFMGDLHIELLQGQNCALVDLFDPIHARNVLAAFGRAFGRLEQEPTKEQESFLDQAVQGLSQDGRVICVRLALFAEMVKGKPWTAAALKGVGGTEGVGVAFLEETFSAAAAPAEHRYHQKAARAVLKSLLPESGADIKGHMRSHGELLEASGYANRLKDFDDLIRILDGEIRLITPTDPEGVEAAEVAAFARTRATSEVAPNPHSGECGYTRFYQLTHDYLVPSLRDWLTRKQKETRRGRAELLLADRAVVWNGRPENRQLPSLTQWFRIRWLTRKKTWTPPQRKMMRKATRYHAVRVATLGVLLAVTTFTGLAIRQQVVEQQKATRAAGLVQAVLNAETAQAPAIIGEMSGYRTWVDPLLHDAQAQAEKDNDRAKQLHASLALLPVDASQVDYLYGRLLEAAPTELPVIRDALFPQRKALCERLWGVLEDGKDDADRRFRAACGLAGFDVMEDDAIRKRWEGVSPFVVERLLVAVQQNPSNYDPLLKTLDPVRDRLNGPLSEVFRRGERAEADRSWATNILAKYAADRPDILAQLLMDADEKQFAVIYPKFKEQGEQGLPLLTGEIDKKLPTDLPSSDENREKLAKRQANVAVALLKMNHPEKVWPLLKHTPPDDPRVRSYLIHRLFPLGAESGAILKRLDEEPDLSIRRALLLSLGEYDEKGLSPEARQAVLPKLQEIYRNDSDPGLHAASEWLLRTWKQEAWLKQVNDEWAKDRERREKRLDDIRQLLTKDKEKTPPQWYVNGQGQTMVVVPGPVEFLMGSPTTEAGRMDYETQHKERIGRTFALAAKSVTVEQYRKFDDGYQVPAVYTRTADLPVVETTWHQAAGYCNWLSKEEGIAEDQWCYEIEDGQVTKLKANYLSLTGYRLPTEAEMEVCHSCGGVDEPVFRRNGRLAAEVCVVREELSGADVAGGEFEAERLGVIRRAGERVDVVSGELQSISRLEGRRGIRR